MLRVENMNSYYGQSHVLFDVSMTVGDGEIVTVLGRNGAGKTTLMQSIIGSIRSDATTIEIDGEPIGGIRPFHRIRRGLGYVPQGGRVFPGLTVLENLEIVRGRKVGEGWKPDRVFELFPPLAQIRGRDAGLLSGGERQMLAVGRALMANPSVILLDEPSEGLAPTIVRTLGDLAQQLKARGIGVLLAEQNHHFALQTADRAYLIEKGRIRHEATASELVGSDELERYLGV